MTSTELDFLCTMWSESSKSFSDRLVTEHISFMSMNQEVERLGAWGDSGSARCACRAVGVCEESCCVQSRLMMGIRRPSIFGWRRVLFHMGLSY